MSGRHAFGVAFTALGLACLFAPDSWIMTPAHAIFFGQVPRWTWGLVHVALGAGCLTRHWRMFLAATVPVSVTWAGVAFYPATQGETWNVVSLVAWLLIGFLAAWATGMLPWQRNRPPFVRGG